MIGVDLTIEGKENLYGVPSTIYTANHQSAAELAFYGAVYPRNTVIIGKKEVIFIPVFGWYFWLAGNVFINRQKSEKAIRVLDRVLAGLKKKGMSVWIYPEGTRSGGKSELLPFKKGAFHMAIQAQIPITPIVLSPLYPVVDTQKRQFNGGEVKVRILPPISTEGLTEKDVPALIERVRQTMQSCLSQLEREVTPQSSRTESLSAL